MWTAFVSPRPTGRDLLLRFLGEVLIPFGDLNHKVTRSISDALAPEARLRRQSWRLVELIEFGVGRLAAGLKPLMHDDVARGARTNPAARMVESHVKSGSDIKDASGQALSRIRNSLGVHLDRLALSDKLHLEFLCRGRVFDLFNVRIAAAHRRLLLNCSILRGTDFRGRVPIRA